MTKESIDDLPKKSLRQSNALMFGTAKRLEFSNNYFFWIYIFYSKNVKNCLFGQNISINQVKVPELDGVGPVENRPSTD